MDGSFTEEDKKKVVEFLNMTAIHADLTMKTQKLIEYYKLLAFMQSSLLPKIDAHILEVKRVIDPPPKGKKK